MEIINILKKRNKILFWFGALNLITAVVLITLAIINPFEFAGANAWYKPIKFALSTTILVWSVGWYTGYLSSGKDIQISNWVIVITLAFEVVYITWKASEGEASHFNQSTPFYAAMFALMGLAASIATLAVGYIGMKFFVGQFPQLEKYYLWALRIGFVLFVVFCFEGFVMGAQLSHTVGAADGAKGLPFLNWSRVFGDLRVAHFIGMHALQILPLLAWFILKNTKLTIVVGILYGCLAVYVLLQALKAKPFLEFIN
ncbi:MAG: manganese efflux pump [Bacteroidetes bacterium]|jgi:hypothetical protein|nr:manganese efflux pump [Bacteroidota bacterium]MDF1866091.1 manganese efflux pump [Saprospiraceae bacterium]